MADVKAKVKTPKKKASKREKKDWIAAYILIAPVTLGLLVFYIWPFIQNVWFSFNDVNKFNMSTFVGLANYKEMIGDKEVCMENLRQYPEIRYRNRTGRAGVIHFPCGFTECKDQRKIHLPYPVFPSFGYHVCSCGHGLEMDLQ